MSTSVAPKIRDFIGPAILTPNELKPRIRDMAREIEDIYLPSAVHIMPIMSGALAFANDLMRQIRLSVQVTPIFCYWQQNIEGVPGSYPNIVVPATHALPERVMVVDDIMVSGRTLGAVKALLQQSLGIPEVKTCVLLRKRSSIEPLFIPDVIGFTVPDLPLVGYGADWKSYFRDLEAIHPLIQEF